MIGEEGEQQGTIWEFVPAGCPYRNGSAESIVKSIKYTLDHMLMSTLIVNKLTLTYTELLTLLSRAANIINCLLLFAT